MENLKELFIPYKQAEDLRRLGFDEPCFGYYIMNEEKELANVDMDDSIAYDLFFEYTFEKKYFYTLAPIYQQAFCWIRDNYKFIIQIAKAGNGNYYGVIHKTTQEYLDKIAGLEHACIEEIVDVYSYEEAELECLKSLIKIIKK